MSAAQAKGFACLLWKVAGVGGVKVFAVDYARRTSGKRCKSAGNLARGAIYAILRINCLASFDA